MLNAFHFTHGISLIPAASCTDGLRAEDTGTPSVALFRQHHADYVAALQAAGMAVEVLEAQEAFPDSTFVEDAALCLPDCALVMRPGAPTRFEEAELMAPHLEKYFEQVIRLDGGRIEGGDIMVSAREILIGTSSRTDDEGVAALKRAVAPFGYPVRQVETPADVLHFKSDSSILGDETVLATKRLAASGCFKGYEIIETAAGEEAAANAIRVNDMVILPAGFPRTAERLNNEGFKVREVGNTEAAKLDGGMSCLSLRFNPTKKV